jgi:hypothetical protein
MKKIIFSLSLLMCYMTSLAQVTTLSNSIGIGQNTLSTIPLHINKPGEVARFQGASPYLSFYNSLNFQGYIQAIGDQLEIGTKNNFNLVFYTNNLPQFNIDGTSGQVTAFQKINALGGLKLSGSLQAQGESVGADGMVLVSKGNATPAWEDQRVGFRAQSTFISVPNYTETQFTSFSIPFFNDGSGFNNATGAFTAPSNGLYTFNIKCIVGVTPTPLDNFRAQIRLIKNSTVVMNFGGEFKTFDNYTNTVETNFLIKLLQNDVVNFSLLQVSPNLTSVNVQTEISGFKVY